ncbi:MAG: response regulator transcription factor [Anaerolineae bacterium]|nr:response regulator transcription factor [Anaerolineae bacterium]
MPVAERDRRKIAVVLADDHPLMREGLATVIDSQPDMHVVGQASDGGEALEITRKLMPDVVLLDISMPGFSGLGVISQIKTCISASKQPVQAVIVTMYSRESVVLRALNAGALGFVTKTSPSSEIIQAIHRASRGDYYLSQDISNRVIQEYLRGSQAHVPDTHYDRLTEREQEIFHLLVEGHSNRSIAELLCISPATVTRHRANIMTKLEVHSFRELMSYAVQIGLLEPELDDLYDCPPEQ